MCAVVWFEAVPVDISFASNQVTELHDAVAEPQRQRLPHTIRKKLEPLCRKSESRLFEQWVGVLGSMFSDLLKTMHQIG